MAEFLKRHAKPGPGRSADGPVECCAWMRQYPAIVEFLTCGAWSDGEARETGTLLLCWGDGKLKLWVNDRDAARVAWLSGDTVTDALDALEEHLRADNLDWRASPGGNGRKKVK